MLQLNTKKITHELKRIGQTKVWLANQLCVSPAMVTWIFKHKPISYAERIGIVFDIDPKDLIKSNNVS